MSAIRAIFLLVAFLGLAACASRGGKIAYDPLNFAAPDAGTINDLPSDLPLGPLDKLVIKVFQVPDLSGDYQVTADGFLNMPLIGRVSVRNLTAEQLGNELERTYSVRYLNNPDISVRVAESFQRNVVVEGGVNLPGVYPLNGKSTLLGAIALARGVNQDTGNAKRVAVFRKIGGKPMAAAFDLVAIRHGEMTDPAIYPGDTIVVDGAGLRSLYRDIIQTLPALAIFRAF